MFEKTLTSREIYDGVLFKVKTDTVLLQDGNQSIRDVVIHAGAVCVVPVTDDNMVYMVKQYRYPFKCVMLEIPAGKMDIDEIPIAAAFRELEEEIGMRAGTMEYMGDFLPSVAYLTEVIHMYIAKGLTPSHQNLDYDEFVEVEMIPFKDLLEMVMSGEIKDGKTIAAVLKADKLING